jgi:phosphohistidine swiveling domain-containing protein
LSARKLKFIKSMEINGISPLPHYYEEIYANQIGIRKLGMRGDKNYLFYSVDGLGAGYYEEGEMELAAQSVHDFFRSEQNRKNFLKKIKKLLGQIHKRAAEIDRLDFSKLSDKQVARYFLEANQLHGWAFSHYIVSQPYRMRLFEQKIRYELSKRVARSRIDHYMTLLTASEKPTKVTKEEIDWLKFLIKHKKKNTGPLRYSSLENDHPALYRDLKKHYEKYKTLTLGDGNWQYSLEPYIDNLKEDFKKDLAKLQQTYSEKRDYSKKARSLRKKLIKELRLDKSTVRDMAFLADIGHTRLVMRVDGWLPFVSSIIKLDVELSKRLGLDEKHGPLLNFMSEEELIALIETGVMVPVSELLARRGKKSEFLILHVDGQYKIYYGPAAGKKFKQLVPQVQHDKITELTGATAVKGKIRATACVYIWGDDVKKKMKVIKKHPILIVGQTRPSMMPIIRLAKGIVTDEGGITSHAAIVSRELGIPSIIGTVHATRVFKDGDKVELDADQGVVRKL